MSDTMDAATQAGWTRLENRGEWLLLSDRECTVCAEPLAFPVYALPTLDGYGEGTFVYISAEIHAAMSAAFAPVRTICEECDGTGVLHYTDGDGDSRFDSRSNCDICDGTGKVNATAQAIVDAWNEAYPKGAIVRYWKGGKQGKPSGIGRTNGKAELYNNQVPVVWIIGVAGCVALTHVEVVTDESDARGSAGGGKE